MCLAIVALDAHPHYALVLVANRDEYHARPTEAAHWWTEGDILAGRALRAGGTWLGVTRWPKLRRTKAGVAAWDAAAGDDTDALPQLLADRERAREDELPNTGVSREWERALSAPFITGENYGTRCSTVLTISRDGHS